ncbi:hypothetical protein ABZ782_09275 [Streptomyces asoensis]|uniref:hypothetical protein n=1 Tax=Streptomyces asoensis TaxID=249586 RepID=UPI0033DE5094
MGERLDDGAGHSRRRGHPPLPPEAAPEGADGVPRASRPLPPGIEALLVRALLPGDPHGPGEGPDAVPAVDGSDGSDGERLAVAAFRAARDAGAHRARTRRRDDWRPRTGPRPARSLRTTLSVLVAGLALGGAAFAAVGAAGDGRTGAAGTTGRAGAPTATTATAATNAPGTRSAPPSVSPPRSSSADRPVSAGDTEAHCRAYAKARGRGGAMDATAWRRLVTAAGGEENVPAYCATREPAGTGGAARTGKGGAGASRSAGDDGRPQGQTTPKAVKSPEPARTPGASGRPAADPDPEPDGSARAQESGRAAGTR